MLYLYYSFVCLLSIYLSNTPYRHLIIVVHTHPGINHHVYQKLCSGINWWFNCVRGMPFGICPLLPIVAAAATSVVSSTSSLLSTGHTRHFSGHSSWSMTSPCGPKVYGHFRLRQSDRGINLTEKKTRKRFRIDLE